MAVVPKNVHKVKELGKTASSIYTADEPWYGKERGNKGITIQPGPDDESARVTLVFEEGGTFPSMYCCQANENGGYSLTFLPKSDAEMDGLRALDKVIKERANNPKWWPEREDEENQIPSFDSYMPVLGKRKKKKTGGGYWPHKVRAGIPLGKDGDAAKSVVIVDHKKNPVSMHNLAGKKWSCIAIELHYIYFKAPTEFGVVKKLKYVRLAKDAGGAVDPDVFHNFGYLDESDAEEKEEKKDKEDASDAEEEEPKPEEPPKEQEEEEKKRNDPPPGDVITDEAELMAMLGQAKGRKSKKKAAQA